MKGKQNMKNLDYPQNLVEVVLGHPNTEISKIELVAGVAFVLESLNTHMSDLVRLKYSNQYSKSQLSIAMFMPESELDRLEELAINNLNKDLFMVTYNKQKIATTKFFIHYQELCWMIQYWICLLTSICLVCLKNQSLG